MKNLLLSLILLVSNMAFAFDFDQLPPGVQIDHQSWCEGDKVTTVDEDGAYTAYDCYDYSRRCVEEYTKKNDWYVGTATCE